VTLRASTRIIALLLLVLVIAGSTRVVQLPFGSVGPRAVQAQTGTDPYLLTPSDLDPALLLAIASVHSVQGDCSLVTLGRCFLASQRADGLVEVIYSAAHTGAGQLVLFAPTASGWIPLTKDINVSDDAGLNSPSLFSNATKDLITGDWSFRAEDGSFVLHSNDDGTAVIRFRTYDYCVPGQVSTDTVACDSFITGVFGGKVTITLDSIFDGVVRGRVVQTNAPHGMAFGPAYLVILTDGSLYLSPTYGSNTIRLCGPVYRPTPGTFSPCGPGFDQ
jgi:hypothetical protein